MMAVVVVLMFLIIAWVAYNTYYYLEVKNETCHHRTLGGVWSVGGGMILPNDGGRHVP